MGDGIPPGRFAILTDRLAEDVGEEGVEIWHFLVRLSILDEWDLNEIQLGSRYDSVLVAPVCNRTVNAKPCGSL